MAPQQPQQPVPIDQLYNSYDRNLYRITGEEEEDSIMDMISADPTANNSTNVQVSASDIGSGVLSGTMQTATGSTQQGKKLFTDTVQGYILGVDPTDGFAKFAIGNVNSFMQWDGSTLTVQGTISGSTIIGGTFETSASGARVVISAALNAINIYDSTGLITQIGAGSLPSINMTLSSVTNVAMVVTSSVAGSGFSYINSGNVASKGIQITQSNTGSGNNLPAIQIDYAGVDIAQLINTTNAGQALFINNTGSANSVVINHSPNTDGIQINNGGNTNAINISTTTTGGNPIGVKMSISNGGGNSYAFGFFGSEMVSAAVTGTQNRKIRVLLPSGAVYYIALYDA